MTFTEWATRDPGLLRLGLPPLSIICLPLSSKGLPNCQTPRYLPGERQRHLTGGLERSFHKKRAWFLRRSTTICLHALQGQPVIASELLRGVSSVRDYKTLTCCGNADWWQTGAVFCLSSAFLGGWIGRQFDASRFRIFSASRPTVATHRS